MAHLFFKALDNETIVKTEKDDKLFNKEEHEQFLSKVYNAKVILIKTVVYAPIAFSNTEILTETSVK